MQSKKVKKKEERQEACLSAFTSKNIIKIQQTGLSLFKPSQIYCRQKNKQKNRKKFEKIFLILSGAVIGLLNGFFGGGGGMVCVPILQKVLKLESKHAHATAIAVILPISLVSAFIYVYNGYLETLPLIVVGAGVIFGGILGSYALKVLPPKAIRIIFAVVMFAGGIKLIF